VQLAEMSEYGDIPRPGSQSGWFHQKHIRPPGCGRSLGVTPPRDVAVIEVKQVAVDQPMRHAGRPCSKGIFGMLADEGNDSFAA
jgi:hypothetical protein